jgi:hypothetical protein
LWSGEVFAAEALQQRYCSRSVGVGVLVPPRRQRRVAGRHHHLRGRHARLEARRERRRRERDALAERAHVGAPEALAEDVDRAARRMQVQRRDAQQRGLARAVGAQHDPALARRHDPADVVEDPLAVDVEPDVRAAKRRYHVEFLLGYELRLGIARATIEADRASALRLAVEPDVRAAERRRHTADLSSRRS